MDDKKASTGLKYDAGKSPIFQGLFAYFPRALAAVADVSAYGYVKYKAWGGWRHVPDALPRYSSGLGRHILDEQKGEAIDPESKLLHASHAAWNALARLELILCEQKRVDKTWVDAACGETPKKSSNFTYQRVRSDRFEVVSPRGIVVAFVCGEEAAMKACRELDYKENLDKINKVKDRWTYVALPSGKFAIADPVGNFREFVSKEETAKFKCAVANGQIGAFSA